MKSKEIDIYDFDAEAAILDAGTFPTNEYALRWLRKCKKIVCCDGAANTFIGMGYHPWRIVGDFDSLSPAILTKYKEIVRHNPDQETNDQTKAVEYLTKKGIRKIVILGATGKREDHTLGNISLLTTYLEKGLDVRIFTDYGVFIPIEGRCVVKCETGTQVSIFNFGATGMRASGLRYPLRDFDNWWQGTLNEATSQSFNIEASGRYLIFVNYNS